MISDSAPSTDKKRASFVRLAEKRTMAVMEKLRILSNLANRNVYEYSEEDVRQIFQAIEEELRTARNRFETTQRRRPEFKLQFDGPAPRVEDPEAD